ncbi:MAG: hydrogenase expression/formation protein HypE, partial [Deltaproteobacteria bacterium]
MTGTIFGACPTPLLQYRQIVLGHGSGGRLTHELIKDVFAPPGPLEDQATLPFVAGRLAVTTDSFVVKPIFFPGGDIGKLAITGSVNDLAVGGARPRFIAAAFILEEGLPLEDLRRIVASMRAACVECEVQLVTGDTKVVDRGKG